MLRPAGKLSQTSGNDSPLAPSLAAEVRVVSQGKALSKSAPELLDEYVRTGSQAPFEEVVRRYAGMVFNVCYQILKDSHDAEDATQAVFLALAVQAKTANGVKYLAPWLQKVAQRLSLDVRRSKTRRKAREERHSHMRLQMGIDHDPTQQPGMDELKIILRDELDKLPSKYRLPLVLHYFGGLKPEEISKELGCKPSTLGVRLHRGRKMLADLLSERGIVVNGSMLTVALAACVQCRISETLIHSTAHAAGAYAAQGTFATAVTPQVFGFNRIASQGIMLAKVKAAVAAGILAAAAAAGAAELVSRVANNAWHFNFRSELQQWLKPVFEDRIPQLRVDAGQNHSDAIAAIPGSYNPDLNFPQTFLRPSEVAAVSSILNSAPTAIAVASVPASNDLRDTPYGEEKNGANASDALSLVTPPSSHSDSTYVDSKTLALGVDDQVVNASSGGSSGGGGGSSSVVKRVLPPAPPSQTIVRNQNGTVRVPTQAFMPKPHDDVSIGALQGQSENFVYDKPGKLSTNQVNVGEFGDGSLTLQNGTVSVQSNLALGSGFGGRGSITLRNDAALYAPTIEVGGDGRGHLTVTDQASISANSITAGANGKGTINLRSGSIQSKQLSIGLYNQGVYQQTGGQTTLTGLLGTIGSLQLGVAPTSDGTFYLQGGTLSAGVQNVGIAGYGHIYQTGGLNNVNELAMGIDPGSLGTYQLQGGTVEFNRTDPGSPAPNRLIVSGSGRAILLLGNENGTGTITETGMGKGTDLLVRASEEGQGQIIGFGRPLLTGFCIQNGEVIADGYGQSRTLDLSSLAAVRNSIDNKADEQNGWYARNGGKLVLPLHRASKPGSFLIDAYTFGEDGSDASLDLVNSVRFIFDPKLDDSMPVMVSLLSAENIATPTIPVDETFATIYGTNFASLPTDKVNLAIRFDAVAVGDNTPRLLAYTSTGWQTVLPSDMQIDYANHVIFATTSPSNFYAVAVPEPVSSGVLLIGSAMLLTRRRRV